jgi:hypothetical protein
MLPLLKKTAFWNKQLGSSFFRHFTHKKGFQFFHKFDILWRNVINDSCQLQTEINKEVRNESEIESFFTAVNNGLVSLEVAYQKLND